MGNSHPAATKNEQADKLPLVFQDLLRKTLLDRINQLTEDELEPILRKAAIQAHVSLSRLSPPASPEGRVMMERIVEAFTDTIMEFFLQRRGFSRISLRCPILVRHAAGFDTIAEGAMTTDVSEGGLRFACRREYPIGALLKISFFSNAATPLVEAAGRVVRVKLEDDMYQIGISTLEEDVQPGPRVSEYADWVRSLFRNAMR